MNDNPTQAIAESYAVRTREMLVKLTAAKVGPAQLFNESKRSDHRLWEAIEVEGSEGKDGAIQLCLRLPADLAGSAPPRTPHSYQSFRQFGDMIGRDAKMVLGRTRVVEGDNGTTWPVVEYTLVLPNEVLLEKNMRGLEVLADAAFARVKSYRA